MVLDQGPGGIRILDLARHSASGLFISGAPGPKAISIDIPPPVLFNPHKHHAGFLQERIRQAVAEGPEGLRTLADELVVVGTKLMDLYHGSLSPREISDKVMAELAKAGRQTPSRFRDWLEAAGGYRVIELPADASRWVLRAGEADERFIHIHPARYSPFTTRIRANVLITAAMTLAYAGVNGGDPLSRPVVNAVRRDYLGLAPVGRDPSADEGLGLAIELLRSGTHP